MGLIASSFRMMYLTAYKITLETKIQWIASAKMELVASSDEIMALGNDLDPDNPAVKQLEARRDKLIILEKKLDLQMQEYQNRLKMVDAEMQSAQGAVDSAIQRSFTYNFQQVLRTQIMDGQFITNTKLILTLKLPARSYD